MGVGLQPRAGSQGAVTAAAAQKNVTFYRNLERLGVVEMPRRLTDCSNGPEGILLGDPGLILGKVTSPHIRMRFPEILFHAYAKPVQAEAMTCPPEINKEMDCAFVGALTISHERPPFSQTGEGVNLIRGAGRLSRWNSIQGCWARSPSRRSTEPARPSLTSPRSVVVDEPSLPLRDVEHF